MKKSIPILLLAAVLMPLVFVSAQSGSVPAKSLNLKRGSVGDSVRSVQQILKHDKAIYPEGVVSGYYGAFTENAVKKLQAKHGLATTGFIDDTTYRLLFPQLTLTIVAPNGGEIWSANKVHTIYWKASIEPVILGDQATHSASVSDYYPLLPKANLFLIKDSDPTFHQYIATVNLLDTRYDWQIPDFLKKDSDYRVLITVNQNVDCWDPLPSLPLRSHAPIIDRCFLSNFLAKDTSDHTFTVLGKEVGVNLEVVAKLKEQIRLMEELILKLQSQLQFMRELLVSLER